VSQALSSLTAEADSMRQTQSQTEQELHKLDIELSETNVRLESLVTRTREEIQIDLAERYEQVSHARRAGVDAPPTADADPNAEHAQAADIAADAADEASPDAAPQVADVQPQTAPDWNAIAEEIRHLRERIQKLGNVNLDAITELEELEKQFDGNATQLADLTDSKQQLEALIEQINQESGVRFAETFAAVREHFQQMFRKLFGGGKADIVLETELEDRKAQQPADGSPVGDLPVMKRIDPLDAGIEIIARPPGKNPVTLSQLSGGEKAMTCIALLMSIFRAKPSPFCILDEVDAPLDEANNVRFGQIVQEFLTTSQFIIITHHKRTMQIADALYGITQQVQGVSTRVPVRFDQVEAGGRIKAEAIAAA
jgi:chromosome segregation protein